MIGNLKRDDGEQPGAGLAQDQPRAVQPPDAGPEGPRRGRAPRHERAHAARAGAHGRVLHHGAGRTARRALRLIASYAYKERKHVGERWHLGEGLVGQAALEKKPILLTNVPDDYIQITSGLGEAPPRNIIVLPILFEGDVKAVVELASFLPFSEIHQTFLDQLQESIGVVLNMIQANMRTEELLQQSQ